MISFEEARGIVLANDNKKVIEEVPLSESLNRILAEDIICDINLPPFNKSAVDGYACRKEDVTNNLKIIDIIAAGSFSKKKIRENECVKIMTGAPVPDGADWVIMVEDTEEIDQTTIRCLDPGGKSNIALKAEDVKAGKVVLKKGICIEPQHTAVIATSGYPKIKVYKKLSVGIISTGSELVEPGEKLEYSQIRNSNGHQLIGQVLRSGAQPNYYGIVDDTESNTKNILKKAFDDNDLLLLTGGVSMGDFDLVPKIMEELELEIHFRKIAVQPGKPTVFSKKDGRYCFGLPGNPVSSYMIFELLVRPLIDKLSGLEGKRYNYEFILSKEAKRKKSERDAWVPALINENSEVEVLEYHGSAHINALTMANVILHFPKGKKLLKKGDSVNVRFI